MQYEGMSPTRTLTRYELSIRSTETLFHCPSRNCIKSLGKEHGLTRLKEVERKLVDTPNGFRHWVISLEMEPYNTRANRIAFVDAIAKHIPIFPLKGEQE